MGDYTPIIGDDDQSATFTAGAAITGGQCVYLSGTAGASSNGTVLLTAGASVAFVGVAAHDAASGSRLTVVSGGIQELVASAAITFGTSVKTAAAGKVATWVSGTDAADLRIGLALTTAAADGDLVRVKLLY